MNTSLPVTEAYDAFAAPLRRFVTARTRDADTAEDIVQEAFVRLEIASQARRFPTNPKAWLNRVALNLVIASSRHADVARRIACRLASDGVVVSPEAMFMASERGREVGAAMRTLGPLGRTTLLLAAEGYTGREIAHVIGLSEGATRTRMCRARSVLRRELARAEAALVA
ncbi:MAG TPA: RNA polymerase sigma factor [Candidatus Limnocylindrales bacterium]|nr:RNA polymerase sigma factor [Candidatus Limnocylindrales bacterium]